MADEYRDNMNIKHINGFTLQEVAYNVWAIDEFGISIMYLIIGTKKALLLDTGVGISDIRGVIETMTDLPYIVVNSHHHYDHVGGNYHFSCAYAYKDAIPIIIKQNNLEYRRQFILSQEARTEYNFEASLRYDINKSGECHLISFEEGYIFELGDRDLEVIYTPGHTKDSVCLLDRKNKLLFSADTIVSTPVLIFHAFSADLSVYINSLTKLKSYEKSYELIFPGHYIRPIGSIYIDELKHCAEEILMNHYLIHGEDNNFADGLVYHHQYLRATIAYTEDKIK